MRKKLTGFLRANKTFIPFYKTLKLLWHLWDNTNNKNYTRTAFEGIARKVKSRKQKIIAEAIKLFGQKGYHSTSVQEIVDQCDISKGSFYNYFKSKEELMLSIFHHYYFIMFEQIMIIDPQEKLTPRQKFINQLTKQIQEFNRHQDFIRMLLREQTISLNEHLDNFTTKIRSETILWHIKMLKEIYPSLTEKQVFDCSVMFSGMIREYSMYIILDQRPLDLEYVAPYILKRMDSIIKDLSDDEPLLKKELIQDLLDFNEKEDISLKTEIIEALSNVQTFFEHDIRITSALQTIESQFLKDTPQTIILEGLFLLLEQFQISNKQASQDFNHLKNLLSYYLNKQEKKI